MFYNNKKNILYNILNNKNITIFVLVTIILVMLILENNKIYEGNTLNCDKAKMAIASSNNKSEVDTCYINNLTKTSDTEQDVRNKLINSQNITTSSTKFALEKNKKAMNTHNQIV